MDRGILKRSTLAFRHLLEGYWEDGTWVPGDLELVLRGYGIFRDRDWLDAARLTHLSDEGIALRLNLEKVIKALIPSLADEKRKSPHEALRNATAVYIREVAYTWFNRLVALRCVEARVPGVDEAIKVKSDYASRSLRHDRFCRQHPELCQGEDGGLVPFLTEVCAEAANELPLLFDPDSPMTLVAPSPDALQKCVRALSGEAVLLTRRAGDRAERFTDDVFREPDLLGWVYQYWNDEEKGRVFEAATRGTKIEGPDIIAATCIYTEDYMVRFLVENSLGALWAETHPKSSLRTPWQYFVDDAKHRGREPGPISDLMFLDPACGSGHFLISAFDLLWEMYQDEGQVTEPVEICRNILERNLYGIDIDERSVQIAGVALYLKAKERAPEFKPRKVNLVAANSSVPADAVQRYLSAHPEDEPLTGVLEAIFDGLENVSEVGSLLQVEEQIDRALEGLRREEARRASGGAQQSTMLPLLGLPAPPVQGRLPLDTPAAWAGWKRAVLDRLHEHFQAEADATDMSTALFGSQAGNGLDLIELLSRRYDVVATNPPYMGSKNMGSRLKRYVQSHYPEGKRDLYAAFVRRCIQLANDGGYVAMVTQQSWMFQRSYADLRAAVEGQLKQGRRQFKGLLRETTILTLAHLGARAFAEISGEVVSVVLFTLRNELPEPGHMLAALRLIGLRKPEDKARALCIGSPERAGGYFHRQLQASFLRVTEAPIVYWVSEYFLGLLASTIKLSTRAKVLRGLDTGEVARFVRYWWEVPAGTRWFQYVRGGGYVKWSGLQIFVVDWQDHGRRLKASGSAIIPSEHIYNRAGLTYSDFATSLGVRRLEADEIPSDASPAILTRIEEDAVLGVLNTRIPTYLLRMISPGSFHLRTGYVESVSLPGELPPQLKDFARASVWYKQFLVRTNLIERTFDPVLVDLSSSAKTPSLVRAKESVMAWLHTAEGYLESDANQAYQCPAADERALWDDLGRPAGSFPLLTTYEGAPDIPPGVPPVPAAIQDRLAAHDRRSVDRNELERIKARLRALYFDRQGPSIHDVDHPESGSFETPVDTGDDSEFAAEPQIPIPSETFLEELSQRLGIHPVSVYWLLQELREGENTNSLPEQRDQLEDCFTVIVLQLLGHCWPMQTAAEEAVARWADSDGIIPLTEGTGQRTLLDRLRERLGAEFGEEHINGIEQEFRETAGCTMGDWLAKEFFPRHLSQFKRRPVAWLLGSGHAVDTRWEATRARRGARRPSGIGVPSFACLIYCKKLSSDTLARVKTHYLRPVLQRREFELAEERHRLGEGEVASRAAVERLSESVDELRAFEAALDAVSERGFWSRRLEQLVVSDTPDYWAQRTPGSPLENQGAFLRQEQAYDPDPNDGVRVNIAPLQKYGLLAIDVIAAKDVDRAIGDRAEWRADERRWCREGKLPRPGWWGDS